MKGAERRKARTLFAVPSGARRAQLATDSRVYETRQRLGLRSDGRRLAFSSAFELGSMPHPIILHHFDRSPFSEKIVGEIVVHFPRAGFLVLAS